MRDFAEVLAELADSVLPAAGGPEDGIRVRVEGMQFDLPLESRFGDGGRLEATLPRGVMATGFDVPHGRFRARFQRSGA